VSSLPFAQGKYAMVPGQDLNPRTVNRKSNVLPQQGHRPLKRNDNIGLRLKTKLRFSMILLSTIIANVMN